MARTKRSASLDSRNKRLDLSLGDLHVEQIRAGSYLIYRRPPKGSAGNWLARWYDPETRKQRQVRLGSADDFTEADGIGVFSYKQATEKADLWFRTRNRFAMLAAEGEVVPEGPYSVADAFKDYLHDAKRRDMKGLLYTEQTANAQILPVLGSVAVAKLTRRKIEDWHLAFSETPRKTTGKPKGEMDREDEPDDEGTSLPQEKPTPSMSEEDKRKRRNTANRVLSILKAALNHALACNKVTEPAPWRMVKPFKSVSSSRVRYLTIAEQRRLVEACEPDFRALVQAALFSGARYGELTRLRVQDFNARNGSLYIEFSKSGKSRHVFLTEEAQAWFNQIVAGRDSCELLLTRAHVFRTKRKQAIEEKAWAPYDQVYCMNQACEAAKLPPFTFHELRHTYASALVNHGVPLAYVAAQLGHSDTRMVERYYGHLSPNAQADSVRSLAPSLGIGNPKVQPLKMAGV
jgi:integrase